MKKNILNLISVSILVIMTTACSEYGRMRETPSVKPHEEPLLIMREGVVPFDGGEEILRNTPGEALQSPFDQDDPEVVAAGKTGYATYCMQCHGKDHDGYGAVGQSFVPKPGDLRANYVQGMYDGDLFKYIGYSKPKSRHPALATTVFPSDRWRIAAYLKSLGLRP